MTPTETGIVEKVARAICYWADAAKNGSCHDNFCVGACSAVQPEQQHYDQARAAIAAMPDSTQLLQTAWQPIETAPRDGTDVLLASTAGLLKIGFWNSRAEAWDDGDFFDHMTWPTHWQPLPELPAQFRAHSGAAVVKERIPPKLREEVADLVRAQWWVR